MGLGFSIRYPVDNNKKTGKEVYERFFRELSTIVPEWKTNSFFDDHGFRVRLVPFEEDIYGQWEDGSLCVSARTNSAGPGYHAWLIQLLDRLKGRPLAVEDETGYYEHRDFKALQGSMMGWLKGLSDHLLEMAESDDCNNLSVSMAIDWAPEDSSHFTCCPLGYFEKSFFERASQGLADGSEFFIWWNQKPDAHFFKNCAANLIWCENNWLPPETKEEQSIIRTTLACLEKAYGLNNKLLYPVAEWQKLLQLLNEEKRIKKWQARLGNAGESTLGYRHGNISSNANGWRITHSGKMHFECMEDGTSVWWDDSITIRLTVMTVQFKEEVENKSQALLQSVLRNESGYEPVSLRNDTIHAAIQHTQYEENGELLWQTRLNATLDNELLILSIYYPDESNRDLVVKICASVAR